MCDAIAHRGPDDWGTLRRGRRRPRHAPAQHHRPGRRPPADGQRGRQRRRGLQRRDLQPREPARASWWPQGHRFRTRSDTEVLVHLYEEQGERMVARLRGMFAFAIWDRRRRRLLLARDHFGQKPLFYTESGRPAHLRLRDQGAAGATIPAGRAVALRAGQYLTLRFVQPPETFFARVRALPPAHFMVWENGRDPDRALLGPGLRAEVDLLRGGDAGADRRAAGGDGQAAPAERRAGRRVPERGPGLDPDRVLRRADARAPSSAPSRWAFRIAISTSCRMRRRWRRGTAPVTSPRR